ncbi:CPBP family intramembrane glutamic endopeptidase [Parafilimonas sp.]|uniref:CPBP family intramembrane glutamic endopeptidase n=1 Tax=Parafilimonas sp. TaxID=1969739 RepID=UPI0039E2638F
MAAILFTGRKVDENYLLTVFIASGYILLLNLPRNFNALQFIHSEWNWSGKILAIIFSFLCIFYFRHKLSLQDVGLTLKFKQGSFKPARIFTICYLSIICVGSFFFQGNLPHNMNKDDILYNTAIMPDFSEELMERGILLVLLNNIFGKKWMFFGAQAGMGLIFICLFFGLEHGLFINHGFTITFLPFDFLRTFFVSALAFGWLKERTGNLVFPTIAHYGTEAILTMLIVSFF